MGRLLWGRLYLRPVGAVLVTAGVDEVPESRFDQKGGLRDQEVLQEVTRDHQIIGLAAMLHLRFPCLCVYASMRNVEDLLHVRGIG